MEPESGNGHCPSDKILPLINFESFNFTIKLPHCDEYVFMPVCVRNFEISFSLYKKGVFLKRKKTDIYGKKIYIKFYNFTIWGENVKKKNLDMENTKLK